MARTLIRNISAQAQTLPAIYGSFLVAVGHGRVVSDETAVAVTELGGFAAMDGKWNVYPVSTDTMLGDFDVEANGLSMLAAFVSEGITPGPTAWADIANKPSFATVATSGSYGDLTDKPALANVATSGAYADLSGTPSIPAASNVTPSNVAATAAAGVQAGFARADHVHAHGNLAGGSLHAAATSIAAGFMSAADKTKLDGLATVATTGAYADLTGKPGNATTSTAGLMSAADKTTLDGLVGTTTTLSNQVISTVGQTGDYNDLINKPNLSAYLTAVPDGAVTTAKVADGAITNAKIAGVAAAKVTGLANVATSGAYADLTGKPALAAVATSGAYADLSGRPSLASVATTGAYADLSGAPARTYDIASYASGAQGLGTTVAQLLAPRNLTLTGLNQTGGATVKVQVAGVDVASYPRSVTTGQLISVVVSVAGTNITFTLTAVEA